MTQKKKASQDKNKTKKGKVQEVNADFRAERDGAEYIKAKKWELNIRARKDYTPRQAEVINTMIAEDTKCVILDAYFGTGKSHMAVLAALTLLNEGKCEKIIYCRNPVESSSNGAVGFLKGTLEEKTAMYNIIMEEKLGELLDFKQKRELLDSKTVDYIAPAFIRGRSLDNTVLIVDEASCLTFEEFVLIISRCGKNTRCFLIGDDYQSDIKGSGFAKFFDAFYDQESVDNGIHCFELKEESDIVRSGFMKFCLIKLGVIKFGKTIRAGDKKDERECAAPRDFMSGEIEEGELIEPTEASPPPVRGFWEKLKFW